ncbi:MAG: thermonuclease family protein [Candidatus Wallbacteria bacterium]|nr:thermonuclease family protein [Candidatus Wallbacteria bacterium]
MIKQKFQNWLLFLIVFLTLFFLWKNRTFQPSLDSVAVFSVHDGDTITVIINHHHESLRLLGIDCPESNQKYGPEATEFTRKFLGLDRNPETTVKLEFDNVVRDKYGRLLAYVFIPGDRMLNQALVSNGLAVKFSIKPNEKYKESFAELQKQAREKGLNIWNPKDPLPETPYEFRQKMNLDSK